MESSINATFRKERGDWLLVEEDRSSGAIIKCQVYGAVIKPKFPVKCGG